MRRRLKLEMRNELSFHSEFNNTLSIRKKEDGHQDKTSDHRTHSKPLHRGDLIFQMHEVADNQRGLHERQAQQNGHHLRWLHALVGEVNLDGGHRQQRAPPPEKQSFTMMPLFFGGAFRESYLNCIHISQAPTESLPTSDRPKER